MSHSPCNHLAVCAFVFVALLISADFTARAAVYTWDPAGGGNSGGQGNWNTTSPYWYNGNTDVAWPNTGSGTAIFAGTGDSVIVASAIQVNTLTFNSPNYYLASGTGGSLILTGNTPTINGNASAFIGTNLSGTAGLTVSNPTGITLGGTNTYMGGTTLAAGALSVYSAGALGSAGTISFNGGTLRFTGTNTIDYSARFSSAANQAYQIDTNGQSVTFAASLSSSGGTLTKLGTGTLTLTGNNLYAGVTNFVAGSLNAGSAGALGSTGTLNFSGGSLQYSAANTTDYSARFSQAAGQLYSVDTNGRNVTFATALNSNGGNLTKNGDGTLTLTGANNYTGGTNFLGGAINVASAGALGSTGTFLFQGGALQYSSINTTDYSNRFSTAALQNFRVDTNGQNITFATGLTSTEGVLTKLGAGTLTLTGSSTFSSSSYATVNVGTLALAPTGSLTVNELFVAGGATLSINGGTVTSDLNVGNNPSTGTATVNLTSGNLNNGAYLVLAALTGSTAVFNQSGGTASGILQLGEYGGNGTYNLSGGTLSTSLQIADEGTGAFNQTGGSVTSNGTILGYSNGSSGSMTIGGTSNFIENNGINVGFGGAGTFTLNGGTVTDANGVSLAGQSSSSGTVNLNGGTLTVTGVSGGAGSSTFNLNGGTLRAGTSSTTFFQKLTTANVQAGGAVLDTNGFNVTVAQNLVHDTTGATGAIDGGLTKNGQGTLTLSGVNTYTGGTNINSGMLVAAMNGALGTGNVNVASGATLSLSTGVMAAHNASTGTTLTLASLTTSLVNLAGSGVQDTVGTLIIGGVTEPVGTYGAVGSGALYTNIADFTGTGELLVVPEPSTWWTVGTALSLGLMVRRLRRSES